MVLGVKPEDEIKSLTYTIQNIVVKISLNLSEDLVLRKIDAKLNNTEYNPERFPGLFIRFKHPKCVIIIFRNGKLILTGLKLFSHINLVIKQLLLKFNENFKMSIKKSSINTEIVNIVGTADFYKQINLDLAVTILENAIYEPEVFPGLIYNSFNPVKSVFLIFSTGKIVFTGIREEIIIEPALINLGRLLDREKLFIIS